MFIKKTMTGVVGVAVLGLATAAMANGGSFAPMPVAAPTASTAQQAESAFYVGAQGGWADTHWNNYTGPAMDVLLTDLNYLDPTTDGVATKSKSRGFAGRAFAGYDFTKYLGVEGGWTYLPTSKFGARFFPAGNPSGNSGELKGRIKNYAFDLMGVVTAPIADTGLSLHAKAGVNYFRSKMNDSLIFANGKSKIDHWGPVFGAGASYKIIDNLYATVDWMRFSGNGKITKFQPNPDVIMGGLTYKFPVDLG